MDVSRGRMLLASALTIGLLALVWAGPVTAADCALSAPPWGRVGTEFAIQGSGFPASAGVDIELAIAGGATDGFTVQSDTSGEFEISFTPEPIDEGRTTVTATAGSTCSAEIQYDIIGANDPAPTAEPVGAATTPAPGAPRTDTGFAAAGEMEEDRNGWLAFGLILLGSGILGLVVVRRPTRDRAAR